MPLFSLQKLKLFLSYDEQVKDFVFMVKFLL